MKLVSWNVNGIRACVKKEFINSFKTLAPDILCLQETKATVAQVKEVLSPLKNYNIYANEASKKGYSGTAIISKIKPNTISYNFGSEEHCSEGRVITLEYENFYLVNVYTPNSKSDLSRLEYRSKWDNDFLSYVKKLEKNLPVIICGDLNVAHKNIDLKNPKSNYNKSAGYTQKEIDGLNNFIKKGFIDTFRVLNPDKVKYSWWSYRMNCREKNVGWRIDYFLCSNKLSSKIKNATIHNEIRGSDHCPITLEI